MFKLFAILFFAFSNLFSLDISTATKEEFLEIKGIGKVIAERIIEYRDANGLNSADELINIRGIGPTKLEKIKAQLDTSEASGIDLTKYK
jgi:competence ComEA-like helix-hairpin-helix protein